MSHNHSCGCNHDLAHCNHCDVVYCRKCRKEWGYNYYYKYWYPYSYQGSSILCDVKAPHTTSCSYHAKEAVAL